MKTLPAAGPRCIGSFGKAAPRRGLTSGILALLVLLLVSACASQPPPQPQAGLRPDLGARWLNPNGSARYPSEADGFWQGFNEAPSVVVLPPGTLLDRFGRETGRYLAPLGASFPARAVAFVCADAPYHTYRVRAPLPVLAGRIAPWFGEPGGGIQFLVDASVGELVAMGVLERLPPNRAAPCP